MVIPRIGDDVKRQIGAVLITAVVALGLVGCTKDSADQLPKVSSAGFGTVPEITFPSRKSPDHPLTEVLDQTDKTGAEVGQNDLVLIDYYGKIWNGSQLPDSTITDGSGPVSISLANPPTPGWKQLAGAKVGDRLMLVMPPAYAYGKTGSSSLDIPADSTLVYVVDIRAAVDPQAASRFSLTMLDTPLPHGITVENDANGQPQVKIPNGQSYPTKTTVADVATGNGEPVAAGQTVAVRTVGTNWDGTPLPNTWSNRVLTAVSADAIEAVGKPLGSEILLITPARANSLPSAQLMQIVGSFPTTR